MNIFKRRPLTKTDYIILAILAIVATIFNVLMWTSSSAICSGVDTVSCVTIDTFKLYELLSYISASLTVLFGLYLYLINWKKEEEEVDAFSELITEDESLEVFENKDVVIEDIESRPLYKEFEEVENGYYLEINNEYATSNHTVEVVDNVLPKLINKEDFYVPITSDELGLFVIGDVNMCKYVMYNPGKYVDAGYYVEINTVCRSVEWYIHTDKRLPPTSAKGHKWVKVETRRTIRVEGSNEVESETTNIPETTNTTTQAVIKSDDTNEVVTKKELSLLDHLLLNLFAGLAIIFHILSWSNLVVCTNTSSLACTMVGSIRLVVLLAFLFTGLFIVYYLFTMSRKSIEVIEKEETISTLVEYEKQGHIEIVEQEDIALENVESRPKFKEFEEVENGIYLEIDDEYNASNHTVDVENNKLPALINHSNHYIPITKDEQKLFVLTVADISALKKYPPGKYVEEGYYVEVDRNNKSTEVYRHTDRRLPPTAEKGFRWVRVETRKVN